MFNLRGIAGDSPFSIQQEAELMIGHVISHGCLNGTSETFDRGNG